MNRSLSAMSVPPGASPPQGYGVPPPSYGMPPPKKNNTATILLIILAVVFGGGIFLVAILAAILFPVFSKVRGNARLATCESNVKQIDLGMIQYLEDNGKYPSSAAGYKATLMPYIKSEQVFHCPADSAGGEAYSMNTRLQGIRQEKIKNPELVVAVYEGKNQTLDFRHDGKAVVGFADGHVQALRVEETQYLRWQP